MIPTLALDYLCFLKPCNQHDIRKVIFNKFLESQTDGVIEFYEFIDILRLVKLYPNTHLINLEHQIKAMQLSGVIRDPKGFVHIDSETNDVTDEIQELTDKQRDEFKEAFKFLDFDKDGWITANELIYAINLKLDDKQK